MHKKTTRFISCELQFVIIDQVIVWSAALSASCYICGRHLQAKSKNLCQCLQIAL